VRGCVEYVTACDGVRIAYARRGQGRVVVWMPPLPARHLELEWEQPGERRWLEWLASRYTLVQYDPRGLGLSDRAVTSFSLDALQRDLDAVVERVVAGGVVLGAEVNSAPLAIAYAARHPERVSHLILWCATTRLVEGIGSHVDALLALAERDWELFTLTAAHLVIGWSAGHSANQAAALLRASLSPEAVPAMVRDAFPIDVTDQLELVRAPTLVLHRRGVPIPLERAVELGSRIPRARLVVLEGTSMCPVLGDVSAVTDAIDDFLGAAAPDEPVRPPTPVLSEVFRCEGEYWTLAFAGRVCRLRDAKGLHHIAYLLQRPGEHVGAVDLQAALEPGAAAATPGASNSGSGDAGPVLDWRARSAYRSRLDELRAVLDEAEQFNDAGRIEAARTEIEFIEDQLAAAAGLGGRERRVGSAAERARLTVTKRIKGAVDHIGRRHPALAEHLARTIRTGVLCAYVPEHERAVHWST
jgi:pimeloyl-ACP methyl ester carboxylesterase